MARGSNLKGGSSKIRFIMLEAELNDGDLSQVTQAIQNALRPATTIPARIISGPATTSLAGTPAQDNGDDDEVIEDTVSEPPKASRPGRSKPRVAKTPTVINDIDLNTSSSLRDIIAEYDIQRLLTNT